MKLDFKKYIDLVMRGLVSINLIVIAFYAQTSFAQTPVYGPWHAKITRIHVFEEVVAVFVDGTPANPAGCPKVYSYMLSKTDPNFDDYYKALLTGMSSGAKFRTRVHSDPALGCINEKPALSGVMIESYLVK